MGRAEAAGDRRIQLLTGGACALLAVAVLCPPEVQIGSGLACSLLLAGMALLLVPGDARGRLSLPSWTGPLLPLAIVSLAAASCRARAVDEALAVFSVVVAALVGRFLSSDERARTVLAGLVAVLASIVALLAVLQHHLTYPQQLRELVAAGADASPYVVARLRAGRPAGPFSLPAALGGFLALGLPITLARAGSGASPPLRYAAWASALLQGYALVLTRSVGGLIAAALSLVLSLPVLAPRRRRLLLVLIPLAAVLLAGLALAARRSEMTGPGGDPLSLRAGNWRVALEMIRDHPLFGTGPGSFGTFYPRYMRPGSNETRFAHDSYLQIASGWGLWTLVPLVAFLAWVASRIRGAWQQADPALVPLAAGASFLAHNGIDFTAFLPGVALPAAVLIGLGAPASGTGPRADGERAPIPLRRSWLGMVVVAAFLGLSLQTQGAAIEIARARESALAGEVQEALEQARFAARLRPGDPAPHAFVAEWVLANAPGDPSLRREGRRQAERAVRLDPESAIQHFDLSLFLSADGEAAAAYRERYAAHRLFPLKETYTLPVPDRTATGGP